MSFTSDILAELTKVDKKLNIVSALDHVDNTEIVSTGILPLDIVMGGGVPRGRVIFFWGEKSSGKSTTIDSICASWLQSNPKALVLVIDSERCFDTVRAQRIGYDLSRTFVYSGDEVLVKENCFDTIEKFQKAVNATDPNHEIPLLIVWDSLSITKARVSVEGDAFASGQQIDARIETDKSRTLNSNCASFGHTCIITMWPMQDGKNRQTGEMQFKQGGAEAMKNVASMIVQVKRGRSKEDVFLDPITQEQIGFKTKLILQKNKITGLDSRMVKLPLFSTSGISKMDALIEFVTEKNSVCGKHFKLSGAWYDVLDEDLNPYGKRINGKAQLAEAIRNSKYLYKLVEFAGYEFYADSDELFAKKYEGRLKDLRKELAELKNNDGKKDDLGDLKLLNIKTADELDEE